MDTPQSTREYIFLEMPILLSKAEIRNRIWKILEENDVARFPKPIWGRIPNFVGARKAAEKVAASREFKEAKVIKVNPDSPQKPVRYLALEYGKLLVMPTPRLRKGFILLDSNKIPRRAFMEASTIKGAFKYGKVCPLRSLPQVDLIVVGSVAVSREGIRVGKGGGYSEIEYGILRSLSLVDEETPVFTTIHDLQIVDDAPREEYDLIVDFIFTPQKSVKIKSKYPKPRGIIWDKLTNEQIRKIPVLLELKRILKN